MLDQMQDSATEESPREREGSRSLSTLERMRIARPEPEDDFFCLRYEVWYPSLDCALRTHHRTCSGCEKCEQGRFNLKRHAASVRSIRFPIIDA